MSAEPGGSWRVSDERGLPMARDRHGRRPVSLRRLATYALVLVIASYALLPAYWTIITAVRPVNELLDRFPSWIPGGFQLDRFFNVWGDVPRASYMFSSVIVVAHRPRRDCDRGVARAMRSHASSSRATA